MAKSDAHPSFYNPFSLASEIDNTVCCKGHATSANQGRLKGRIENGVEVVVMVDEKRNINTGFLELSKWRPSCKCP